MDWRIVHVLHTALLQQQELFITQFDPYLEDTVPRVGVSWLRVIAGI